MICKQCAIEKQAESDLEDGIQDAWLLRKLHQEYKDTDWEDESSVVRFAESVALKKYVAETQTHDLTKAKHAVIDDATDDNIAYLKKLVKEQF